MFTRIAIAISAALLLAAGAPRGAAAQAAADALRPGDIVRLKIWREPELSGEFPVDENGIVVLPKLGPVQVGGEAPDQLRTRLAGAYERFLQHTSIEVTLLRRVQVLGAVRNPGLYPVDATMTVSDALALAGGTTPQGRPDRVELIRGGRRLDMQLTESTRIAATAIRSGDQLYVPERGWLSRNTGIVAAALTGTVSLLVALIR